MKNTERFSNRVENYARFRPHYPNEIIPFLKKQVGLSKHSIIADIGSGTGLSAEIFLKNGNKVFGIEPNKEMREAAVELFKKDKNFISVEATAENTSLPDSSVNLIVAGQAFHWFDRELAKKEFQRIVAPEGHLVLMWNDRKMDSGFQQAYEGLLNDFAVDYEQVNHRNVGEAAIRAFFSPFPYFFHSFSNSQSFDLESLKGRLLSSSFAPLDNDPNYKPMMGRLEQIFKEFSLDSRVEFAYNCKIYYGKIKEN